MTKTNGGHFCIGSMALHVHYKTLYVSQPFSAKQQREIITFCVFKATRTFDAILNRHTKKTAIFSAWLNPVINITVFGECGF